MSTITVSNIKATGETASRAVSGVAAVWISFTGSASINASFNISALVDNGTGDFTTSISSAMDSATYAVQTSARDLSTGTNLVIADPNDSRAFTASASHVWAAYGGNGQNKTLYDANDIEKTIHGDLA